jgi:hypothetical protein
VKSIDVADMTYMDGLTAQYDNTQEGCHLYLGTALAGGAAPRTRGTEYSTILPFPSSLLSRPCKGANSQCGAQSQVDVKAQSGQYMESKGREPVRYSFRCAAAAAPAV